VHTQCSPLSISRDHYLLISLQWRVARGSAANCLERCARCELNPVWRSEEMESFCCEETQETMTPSLLLTTSTSPSTQPPSNGTKTKERDIAPHLAWHRSHRSHRFGHFGRSVMMVKADLLSQQRAGKTRCSLTVNWCICYCKFECILSCIYLTPHPIPVPVLLLSSFSPVFPLTRNQPVVIDSSGASYFRVLVPSLTRT